MLVLALATCLGCGQSAGEGSEEQVATQRQEWGSTKPFADHQEFCDEAVPLANDYARAHGWSGDFYSLETVKAWNVAQDSSTDTPEKLEFFNWLYGEDAHKQYNHMLRPEGFSSYTACAFARRAAISATLKALYSRTNRDIERFNRSVGAVTHTIQDSTCPAHTQRDEDTGQIQQLCTIHWSQEGSCQHCESWQDIANYTAKFVVNPPLPMPWSCYGDLDEYPFFPYKYNAILGTQTYLLAVYDAYAKRDSSLVTGTGSILQRMFDCAPLRVDKDGDGIPAENYELDWLGTDCDDKNAAIGSCLGKCEDPDGDGVPDGCDPCPSVPDPNFKRTNKITPGGPDHDGDGLSDECDACPSDKRLGRPGQGIDLDYDGVPRECDNCVTVSRGCDYCKTFNPPTPCNDNTPCPPNPSGDQWCIRSSQLVQFGVCSENRSLSCTSQSSFCTCIRLGEWGRCALQLDTDGDGMGDECDNCPEWASLDTRNSNLEAEDWIRADPKPFLDDICDPVPLLRMRDQDVHCVGSDKLEDKVKSPYWNTEIVSGASWIGYPPASDSHVPQPAPTPDRRIAPFTELIAFRHCSCYDQRDPTRSLDQGECALRYRQCNPTVARNGDLPWRAPTITPLYPYQPMSSTFQVLGNGSQQQFTWAWRDDVRNERIDGRVGVVGGNPPTFTEVSHGVMASIVREAGGYKSDRDSTPAGQLRAAVTMYTTPMIHGCANRVFLRLDQYTRCEQGSCAMWDPIGPRIYPPDANNPLEWIRDPGLVAVQDGRVGLHSTGFSMDITDKVSSGVVAALQQQSQWAWLSPSEPASFLQSRGVGLQVAVLPRASNPAVQPLIITTSGGRLQLSTESDTGTSGGSATSGSNEGGLGMASGQCESSATSPLPGVRLTEGGQALFSALDQMILVVGGKEDGKVTGVIRGYDLTRGGWITFAEKAQHKPSGLVLAAAQDVVRSRLYVLDVTSRGTTRSLMALRQARLIAYDLGRGTSRLLFQVPYIPLYATVRLAVGEDGYVLVVASGFGLHTVWRIDALGASARFAGFRQGLGEVLDSPLQGVYTPLLPILRNREIAIESLEASTFQGPGRMRSCDSL